MATLHFLSGRPRVWPLQTVASCLVRCRRRFGEVVACPPDPLSCTLLRMPFRLLSNDGGKLHHGEVVAYMECTTQELADHAKANFPGA